MKLACTHQNRWGSKVLVCNETIEIGPDGMVEVNDEQAAALLANANGKWVDPTTVPKQPAKRRSPASAVVLADSQGNELSPEETEKVLNQGNDDPPDDAPGDPNADPDADDGEDWPVVTMDMSRDGMLNVLAGLADAGHTEAPKDPTFKGLKKQDLLTKIQEIYESMA